MVSRVLRDLFEQDTEGVPLDRKHLQRLDRPSVPPVARD